MGTEVLGYACAARLSPSLFLAHPSSHLSKTPLHSTYSYESDFGGGDDVGFPSHESRPPASDIVTTGDPADITLARKPDGAHDNLQVLQRRLVGPGSTEV
ncbi:hypothetical protein K525DRAFT_275562 [Schizophyllum commune Loenen D]|nr:hypothetical protein K525DRAFT_275562 [Schizophyllum commune Loenen D]